MSCLWALFMIRKRALPAIGSPSRHKSYAIHLGPYGGLPNLEGQLGSAMMYLSWTHCICCLHRTIASLSINAVSSYSVGIVLP